VCPVPKDPIELMFNKYRRQLLATLMLRPDERFHVRELGRMTEIPAGSLHRELKAMGEAGLLLRQRIGNQVFYQVDAECNIYDELAAIFRKTIGLASLLREALAALSGKIDVAFVFGSMASGSQKSTSDLDICVLGNVTMLEVLTATSSVQESLQREINPIVMTTSEFAEQIVRQNRFVLRVSDETKLFVLGNQDEFGKLVENRKA
jgi:predicted nucleotidyltransferase